MPTGDYELVVTSGAGWTFTTKPKYRRFHATFEKAEQEAFEVGRRLDEEEGSVGRQYVIFGPGCGPDGRNVRSW